MFDDRFCRQCGCTEYRACVDDVHGPCWWVEGDLCSHCAIWNARKDRVMRITLGALVLIAGVLFWIWTH